MEAPALFKASTVSKAFTAMDFSLLFICEAAVCFWKAYMSSANRSLSQSRYDDTSDIDQIVPQQTGIAPALFFELFSACTDRKLRKQ